MNQVATIGYEGARPDDFIETLLQAGIEILVDVREVAMSRRKGFAKTALRELLESNGIAYVHKRDLGDPKEGRDAARSGDFKKFRQIFNRHMRSAAAKHALSELANLADDSFICLLCYEREPKNCHRSIVVDELVKVSKVEPVHLGVREGISQVGEATKPKGRSGSAGQSIAACR